MITTTTHTEAKPVHLSRAERRRLDEAGAARPTIEVEVETITITGTVEALHRTESPFGIERAPHAVTIDGDRITLHEHHRITDPAGPTIAWQVGQRVTGTLTRTENGLTADAIRINR